MKRVLLIFSLLLLNLYAASAQAQNYKYHTLIIYTFARGYIQWPENYTKGDFEIVVLGDSPIYDELKTMASAKKIGDRSFSIRKISSTEEIKKCNILYVSEGLSDQLSAVLKAVGDRSILVITESPGLAVKGSCVNFISKDSKPAFELNQAAINKQNLKASAEITRMAIMI